MKQNKKTLGHKAASLLILFCVLAILIKLAIALPLQSHPGEEITSEITQATLSCDNIQQSDITDDADFCVDVDTKCTTPGLCTQLCLSGTCISSFSEVNQMCNATDTCNQLCLGSTCITSFSAVSGNDVVGTCGQGFIREVDVDGNIVCDEVAAGDILDGTITGTDILDGTITPADLDAAAGYCAGGICGKVEVTSTTTDHPLIVKNTADHSVIDISSPTGKYSSIDLYEGPDRRWGLGKGSNNNFYIGNPTADWLVIKPDGGVGIGVLNPDAKLDVDGTIKQNGNQVCDDSNNCAYLTSEVDPYISEPIVNKWCKGDGAQLVCNNELIITSVGSQAAENALSPAVGQVWFRTDI